MNYILRITVAFLLIFILQFYFYKKNIKAFKLVFGKENAKPLSIAFFIFFVYANMYIVVMLGIYLYERYRGEYALQIPETFWFAFLFTYPFWSAFILFVQTALFYVVIDVIFFFVNLFTLKTEKVTRIKFYLVFAVTIIFVFYIPFRIIFDHNVVLTRQVEYVKKDLPSEFNNLRITFISDIQADYYNNERRLNKFINETNATNPDLVLIAGDLITSGPDYIETSARYLSKIKAKYGVYSCVGDHDNWAYRENTRKSLRLVGEAMAKVGVGMLDDSSIVINYKGRTLGISFLTNTYVETAEEETFDKLFYQIKDADLKIFLTHQPRERLIDEAERLNYDLYLAGHTHGGQITFAFPFLRLSPTLFETRYVRGEFWFGDMLAIINRGWGMSLAPIRYNSTPEIIEIILKRG